MRDLRSSILLITFLGAAALTACGEDSGKGGASDSDATTTPPDTTTGESDAPPGEVSSGCMALAPSDLEPLVFDKQDDVSTSYSLALKVSLGVPAADYLVLQFINYNERIDDAGVGTFALDEAPNDDFGSCAECVAIWVDQARPELQPGKFLFQSSGSIRLEYNPRSRRLVGQLSPVVFREVALDPMTLSSTFVEGGLCVELTAPIDFDFRWVPPEWTCGPASYHTDDGCDCDCGAVDPDCYPSFDTPTLVPSSDCAEGKSCRYDRCVSTCEVAIAGRAGVPCPGGEFCTFDYPVDVCVTDQAYDAARLGESCTSYAIHCAVTDGMPAGACSLEASGPGKCSALCNTIDDCPAGEECVPVIGTVEDGNVRGYCGHPPVFE